MEKKINQNRIYRFVLKHSLENIIDKSQIHKISSVLRLSSGCLLIGIFEQKEFLLEIKSINKNNINLKRIEEIQNNKELPFNIHVYLPLLKGDKLDFLLQKLTEIGISMFTFIEFQYSVKRKENMTFKFERWAKIIEEAVEQSERVKIPIINQSILSVQELKIPPSEKGFVFLERSISKAQNIFDFVNDKTSNKHLVFGPEGGITDEEKELMKNAGFEVISLGNRILRAETAIILGSGLFTLV